MKTIDLRYPLPCPVSPELWQFVATLNRARGLPLPTTSRRSGRWFLELHPDDYDAVLGRLQALSIEHSVPLYSPPAPGWVEWPGGERPVPALALVDYRLRSGHTITRGAIADDLRWSHGTPPSGGDIVAYRLHENK